MVTTETRDAQPGGESVPQFNVPDSLTRKQAERAANFLADLLGSDGGMPKPIRLASGNGAGEVFSMSLPQLAVELIVKLLTEIGNGHAVVVEAVEAELTTQQAADILTVSRPYLIGLLEEGAIPYRRVGNRRKISLMELLDYKRRDDKYRDEMVDELTREGEHVGLHFLDFEPEDKEEYDRKRKARICPASRLPQKLWESRQYDGARTATITQFMRDFSTDSRLREYIVSEPPPPESDPTDLALTAAAVHALCEYYEHPVPDWVHGIRAPEEVTMTGIPADTEYGRYIKTQAPPACSEHGVYFEKLMIIPKAEMLRQAGLQ